MSNGENDGVDWAAYFRQLSDAELATMANRSNQGDAERTALQAELARRLTTRPTSPQSADAPRGMGVPHPAYQAAQASQSAATPRPRGQIAARWVLGIVALLVVGTCVAALSGPTTPITPDAPKVDVPGSHGTMAHVQCRDFVRDRLRAPSTADFPFLDYEARWLGENRYQVISYVDAQNAFGAQIRNRYWCTVERTAVEGGPDRWRLIDLQMSE